MSQDATRIETLRLLNYRRFEEIVVAFDPELTVLVGANGGGKTAILDALISAWGRFVDALGAESHAARLAREDIRRVVSAERTMEMLPFAKIEATALVAGKPVSWTEQVTPNGAAGKTAVANATAIADRAAKLRQDVIDYAAGKQAHPPTLPLLCYYGTGRLWKLRRSRMAEQADTSRFSGYTDCLSPSLSFQFFESWFRRFAYEAQSESSSHRASPHKPRERLKGVCTAVGRLLAPSGWQDLEWDFAEDNLVASHPENGRLPIRLLSDGIRNMIGLVGDIAHRAVRLNPHLGAEAPLQTPGIVMIDEVDMHLHPAWQQTVVASLREAFPAMQIIATTHSHLVISTVPSRCVRILEADGSVSTPTVETQGYDSPFALGVVFGVNSNPPVESAQQLTRYRALLELGQGDSREAAALRRLLLEHFGAKHPAMLEADGLRRLQELKARIGATRGGS